MVAILKSRRGGGPPPPLCPARGGPAPAFCPPPSFFPPPAPTRRAIRTHPRAARPPHLAAARPTACPAPPATDPLAVVSARELVAAIDDELAALPERYRLPLLLCGLDGLARDEAAARLGWT